MMKIDYAYEIGEERLRWLDELVRFTLMFGATEVKPVKDPKQVNNKI